MNEIPPTDQQCLRSYSMIKVAIILMIGVVFSAESVAQSKSVVSKDPRAVEIIRNSLVAMKPRYADNMTVSSVTAKGTIELIAKNGEWQTEDIDYADRVGDSTTEFRRHVSSEDGHSRTYISNHGHARQNEDAKATDMSPSRAKAVVPDYAPFVMLSQALTSELVSLTFLGEETYQEKRMLHISTVSHDNGSSASSGYRRDWYFDKATGLPTISLAAVPLDKDGVVAPIQKIVYSGYQQFADCLSAVEQSHFIGHTETMRIHIKSLHVSAETLADNTFTAEK